MTVAHFREPYEAHIAKGLLESHGVPAIVFDEHIVWMNWMYSLAVGGVKVKVPPEFVTQAKELLEQDFSSHLSQIPESSLPKAPGDICPECSSESVNPNLQSMWWLIPSIFFLLPIFYRFRKYRCDGCGHQW